jgi:hypothetical protein
MAGADSEVSSFLSKLLRCGLLPFCNWISRACSLNFCIHITSAEWHFKISCLHCIIALCMGEEFYYLWAWKFIHIDFSFVANNQNEWYYFGQTKFSALFCYTMHRFWKNQAMRGYSSTNSIMAKRSLLGSKCRFFWYPKFPCIASVVMVGSANNIWACFDLPFFLSCGLLVIHWLRSTLPWKIFFSFVPNAHESNGM